MNETRLARSSKLLKLDDGYNKIYYPFSFYFCLSLKLMSNNGTVCPME